MSDLPARIRSLLASLSHRPDGAPALRHAALARAAASAGGQVDEAPVAPLPAPLAAWVDAVAARAWEITDDDLEQLRAAGVDEDTIYEVTVAAAVGAGLARMQIGLRALSEAR
jgi:hypothetical protein